MAAAGASRSGAAGGASVPPQPRGGREAHRPNISDVYAGGARGGDGDGGGDGAGGIVNGSGQTIGAKEESGEAVAAAAAARGGGTRLAVPNLRGDDVFSSNSHGGGTGAGAGIMSPLVVSRAKRLLAGVANMDESADVRKLAEQALATFGGARAS